MTEERWLANVVNVSTVRPSVMEATATARASEKTGCFIMSEATSGRAEAWRKGQVRG